ncbi:N-acetylmuramoyl-L-alanine amidase-like domain-containing protein [[Mycoplasma] collis]|uniref:N-acetylmuramoyl-L-alanine amidase-like domain-containing protein n=1 Tax=[Mycoplasma] collis TaxID=2127 RepID=UPI00068BAEC9|nr:N-acetylmuramoyl-L-alanine amidase-like domain-containing protein [[Mycoplasma] collis]
MQKEKIKQAKNELDLSLEIFEKIFANYKKEQKYFAYLHNSNKGDKKYEFNLPIITNELSLKIIEELNTEKQKEEYKKMSTNEKIVFLSGYFLEYFNKKAKEINKDTKNVFGGIPYFANRMFGNADKQEKLVVLLNEFDCFTYFDYVNAFLIDETNSEKGFLESLVKTCYAHSKIDYSTRKHFFTDWGFFDKDSENKKETIKIAEDLVSKSNTFNDKIVTIGSKRFKRNGKISNNTLAIEEVREEVLKGVPIIGREIKYIDLDFINN